MLNVLVATINHNLPELTDNIVNQFYKNEKHSENKLDLMVVDNGSEPLKQSKHTTHKISKNIFYGGALNYIFEYFNKNDKWDYVYVLNNDLLFNGYNFFDYSVTQALFDSIDIYSPSVINAMIDQCYWKQMYNWYSYKCRQVKWVDFQCPLFSKRFVNKINQFPKDLFLGWGQDILSGILAEEMNFKICVDDTNTICHLHSQTMGQKAINLDGKVFAQNAERNMHSVFTQLNILEKNAEFREFGANYYYNI